MYDTTLTAMGCLTFEVNVLSLQRSSSFTTFSIIDPSNHCSNLCNFITSHIVALVQDAGGLAPNGAARSTHV